MFKQHNLFPACIAVVIIVLFYFIDNTINNHLINIGSSHYYLFEGVLGLVVLFTSFDLIRYYIYLYKWQVDFDKKQGTHLLSGQVIEFIDNAYLTELSEHTINSLLKYMNNYSNDDYFSLTYDPSGPLVLEFWEVGINQPLSIIKFYSNP